MEMVMAAQHEEVVGRVVGYTVVIDPDGPEEHRLDITTVAEWGDWMRRIGTGDYPYGARFYTKVLGPDGVEESHGAHPVDDPIGTLKQRLECSCGTREWFSRSRHEMDVNPARFVCEACRERRAYDRIYSANAVDRW
jgi:hypothetical protein